MGGKLYVVATPIGNCEDITERAKRILTEADIVAAEDTRTTQKLLSMLGIQNKMVSNHKFNEKRQVDYLISELSLGKNVAIVSDAGTPCISDPGHAIVHAAIENGIEVIGVCGASSVITALSVSGFFLEAFAFYGFFPRESKGLRETLRQAKRRGIPACVFFESPRRIMKTLQLIVDELPGSEVCLCNDLTKLYERVYRGAPQNVLDEVAGNPSAEKGEYTLVLYIDEEPEAVMPGAQASRESLLIDYIVKNGGSVKSAVQALQEQYRGQIPRREFYAAALHLKELLPELFPPEDHHA